jgi:glutathione S-transferase
VPALEHDGFWLAESMAILEYVEEAWPAPDHPRILPTGLRDRARARQLLSWTRSDLGPLKEARPTTTMFYERATAPLTGPAREAADKVLRVADRLVAEGATTLFDQWCIADADLAFILHRLILNGDDVPSKLRAYGDANWARPSVRAFLDHPRRPYVAHP